MLVPAEMYRRPEVLPGCQLLRCLCYINAHED
jgi:hypothetical protein